MDSSTNTMRSMRHQGIGINIPVPTSISFVTMTTLPMTENVSGASIIGNVCEINRIAKMRNGVAIISDNAGFEGIDTAIHEVAHALGLNHDGKDNDCPDGNIMTSSADKTINSTLFSRCSKKELSSLLSQGKFHCMYNKPTNGKGFLNQMPGKMMSLDKQCQKLGHRRACTTDVDDLCVTLKCFTETINYKGYSWEDCKEYDHGAAPGSPCGPNDGIKRFCLLNRCLHFRG